MPDETNEIRAIKSPLTGAMIYVNAAGDVVTPPAVPEESQGESREATIAKPRGFVPKRVRLAQQATSLQESGQQVASPDQEPDQESYQETAYSALPIPEAPSDTNVEDDLPIDSISEETQEEI